MDQLSAVLLALLPESMMGKMVYLLIVGCFALVVTITKREGWGSVRKRVSKRAQFRALEPKMREYLREYRTEPEMLNDGQFMADSAALVNARLTLVLEMRQLGIPTPEALKVKDAPAEWTLQWMFVMSTFASQGAIKEARTYEFNPRGFTGREEKLDWVV